MAKQLYSKNLVVENTAQTSLLLSHSVWNKTK